MLRVFDCAGSAHDSPMTSRTVLPSASDHLPRQSAFRPVASTWPGFCENCIQRASGCPIFRASGAGL